MTDLEQIYEAVKDESVMMPSEKWKKAFDWYNQRMMHLKKENGISFYDSRFRIISMGCRPCYHKVREELKKVLGYA